MLTMYLLYSHSIVILCLTLVSQPVLSRDTIGQAPISQPQQQLQRHLDQQEATSSSRDSSSNLQYYYYTRTRDHPSHLRVAEEVKNPYVDEVKHESRINGTKYEYYKSSHLMSYDELVYETIDKIFRHRLSPFYLHHYDQDDDKRRSSDPSRVSQESCARDLLYLVEKLPKRSLFRNPFASLDDDLSGGYHSVPPVEDEPLTPELTAFFDSYARQEAGLLRGNTYWTGSHDQCVNRHIFELIDSGPASTKEQLMSTNSGESAATQQHQDNARRRQEAATSKREQRQQVVSFRGRYCVAALKAPVWDKLIENKKTRARNYFKSERQFQEYSKLFRLQLGICLPDSCDSTALERHMDEIKLLAKSTLEPRFADYELIDLYCLPDETSPLRQWSGSAIGFIVLMTVWLAIILMATLADVLEIFDSTCDAANGVKQTEETSGSRLSLFVRLLSLRANYRKLMHVGLADEGDGEDDQKGSTTTTTTTTTTTGQDKKIFKEDAQQAKDDAKQQDLQPQEPHQEERTTTSSSATEATSTSTTDPARRPQIRVDLRFLNAFKALIMFWIINGHIMLLMIQTAKNILDSDALLNGLMHFLIGATFGVDLFFTMTGFLTAYLLFNSGHAYKMKPATWIYLSFHRYWRLAPMYLLAFWFSRSVVQSLGSGPLWDYGTSNMTFRGLCNSESWWYPLTLTSNLHGLFEECMITSWYISCDMQFWLVSPVFVYLLAKSPLNGWLVTILTIAGSSKVRYDAILADKSARYDELVQPRADIFMRVSHDLPALYTHPHHRISAYLIGLLAGHYVYMIKSGKWKSILTEDLAQKQSALSGSAENITTTTTKLEVKKLKKPTDNDGKSGSESSSINNDNGNGSDDDNETDEPITTTMTRELDAITSKTTTSKTIMMTRAQLSRRRRNTLAYLGLALFLIMASCSYLLANYFPSQYLKHSKPIAAIFYSLDHLAMSLGASLIIVTICLGQWHRVARFLSHPNWTRLSKINYALLLLQCEAIYFQIFRYEQVPLAGTRELINILFNLLVTLYPIAFMATLVFEFPLANLEKVAMKALVFGGRRSSGSGSNKKMN